MNFDSQMLVLLVLGIIVIYILSIFLNTHECGADCRNNQYMLEDFSNNNPVEKNNTAIYLYYADWCGHCNDFKPTWEKLKKDLKSEKNIKFVSYNCSNGNVGNPEDNVEGYPTIIIEKNGMRKKYNNDRNYNSIIKLLKE